MGRASSSLTVPEGLGYGAAIGVPVGILVAYGSDEYAKYYILSSNNAQIRENNRTIRSNQDQIEEVRALVGTEEAKGFPDEDKIDHIYLGPTLGNPWR